MSMNTLRKLIVSCLAVAALAPLSVTASKAQAQAHSTGHAQSAARAVGAHGARIAAARAGHHHPRAYAVYYRLTPAHPWVWYQTYRDERQAGTASFNLRARYPTLNVLIRPVR
jgi:hypothetical protein